MATRRELTECIRTQSLKRKDLANQAEHAHDHLLGGVEGQVEVFGPVLRVQRVVVKGVREEIVHQGTEGHAVGPAPREVVDVHVLLKKFQICSLYVGVLELQKNEFLFFIGREQCEGLYSTAIGGGRSMNNTPRQDGWGERSSPRSATVIHSVAEDRTPNLRIGRRTHYHWAMTIILPQRC